MSSYVSSNKELLLQRFIEQGYLVLPPELIEEESSSSSLSINHDVIYDQASHLFQKKKDDNNNNNDPGNNILPEIPELYNVLFGLQQHQNHHHPKTNHHAHRHRRHLDVVLRLILGNDYLFHAHRRCHDTVPGRTYQAWHKDTYKGRQYQPNHNPVEWVMAMYYPQDVTLELGPTELWPGSQYYRGDYNNNNNGIDNSSNTQCHQWNVTPKSMICRKGTIVLIHFDIWHRAGSNTTTTTTSTTTQQQQQQRFMFKFQFARMTFGRMVLGEQQLKQSLLSGGKKDDIEEDESIYSQILQFQNKLGDDIDGSGGGGGGSPNSNGDKDISISGSIGSSSSSSSSLDIDNLLLVSLDIPKLLHEIQMLRHATTTTTTTESSSAATASLATTSTTTTTNSTTRRIQFQKGRGQLVKQALDQVMLTAATAAVAVKIEENQKKKLRKSILQHLNHKIDEYLNHYDQEQSTIRFIQDRHEIWNHAKWCYGYYDNTNDCHDDNYSSSSSSSSSSFPPNEKESTSSSTTTSNSTSSLSSLKHKLTSPHENERLAAAYRLADLGELGVKVLLDVLMSENDVIGSTTTTPQRRNIVYGLIAACRRWGGMASMTMTQNNKTTLTLIENVFVKWLETNIFNGETMEMILTTGRDRNFHPSSISNDDDNENVVVINNNNSTASSSYTSSQMRRGREGYDFEFSKEATNKTAELHYCIIFILANSVFMMEEEGKQEPNTLGRLLLADCTLCALVEKQPDSNKEEKEEDRLYSIQCVAVEGLGRWLSATENCSSSSSSSSSSSLNHERIKDDKKLALNIIATHLESPCDDLRCAVSLALARCPPSMILSIIWNQFQEVITRQLNNDTCRYVRSYLFEMLVRSVVGGTSTKSAMGIDTNDIEKNTQQFVTQVVDTLCNHLDSQKFQQKESHQYDPKSLLRKLLSNDVDPLVKRRIANELVACRWCDLTTSKNRW